MNLNQLYYFVVTCENDCNMSAAAKQLTISQSAISYAVRNLEQEFGFELFYRGTRKLELTDTGKEFFKRARVVIQASRDLSEYFHRGRPSAKPQVRIGTTPLLNEILRQPISHMGTTIPISLENLYVFQTSQLLQMVDAHEIDVAILGTSKIDDYSGYKTEHLAECFTSFYTSTHNALAKKRFVEARDLSDEPIFLFVNSGTEYKDMAGMLSYFIPGLTLNNIKGSTTDISAVADAITTRECSCLLAHGAIPEVEGIKEIPIKDVVPFEITAVFSPQADLPGPVPEAIEGIAKQLG